MKDIQMNNDVIQESLERLKEGPTPVWLNAYLDNFNNNPDLPYFLLNHHEAIVEEDRFDQRFTQRKELVINKIALAVRTHIVRSWWFELLIIITVIATSVIVGIELDANKETFLQSSICSLSMGIFTLEFLVKLIAEGDQPRRYFTNSQCVFNVIDLAVLASWYALLGKGMINIDQTYDFVVFRFLRVIRLLTIIEYINPLKLILKGMIDGLKSSVYILFLLTLVLFVGAMIAVQFFGKNDPANFGQMGIAVVSLFQVSTTSSWSSLAYVSLYGCDNYMASAYDGIVDELQEKVTPWGTFSLWDCTHPSSHHGFTPLFYVGFIVIASATLSLFIASICASMFIAINNNPIDIWQNEVKSKKELSLLLSPDSNFNMALERVFSNYLQMSSTSRPGFAYYCRVLEESKLYQALICCLVFISCVGIGLSVTVVNDDHTKWLYTMHLASFLIFLVEVSVKIGHYSLKNNSYLDACEYYLLHDKWNLLDTLIVAFALIEMLPLFDFVPVKGLMVFRFIHLLRLSHRQHLLPRLRALIDSFGVAMHTLFWIIIMALIFNYVMACVGMILFRKNDPFHFGKFTSAFFTIWRIETGDRWDEILRINMYGCESFPLGYPYLNNGKFGCDHDDASGYLAFGYMVITVILGGYILPSVLIGVIGVHLQASFQRYTQEVLMDSVQSGLIDDVQSMHKGWWNKERLALIQSAFNLICENESQKTLTPKLGDVKLKPTSSDQIHIDGDDSFEEEKNGSYLGGLNLKDSSDRNSLEVEMIQLKRTFKEGKKSNPTTQLKCMKRTVKDLLTLLDLGGDRLLSISEFVSFVIMTKQLQLQVLEDDLDPTSTKQLQQHLKEETVSVSRHSSEPTIQINRSVGDLNNNSSTNSLPSSSKSAKRGSFTKMKKKKSESMNKEASFKGTSAENLPKPPVSPKKEVVEKVQTPTNKQPDAATEQIQRNIEARKKEKELEDVKQTEQDEVSRAYVSVWEALLQQLGEDDISLWKHSLEKLFKSFDKDGSEDLDFNELGAGIKSFGVQLSPLQLNAFRQHLDSDQDGRVTMEEFTEAALKAADDVAKKHFKPNKKLAVVPVQKDPLKAAEEARVLAQAADMAQFVAREACLAAQSAEEASSGESVVYDEAWAVILKAFSADDPSKWNESVGLLFESFDRDGSGDIDIHELGAGLKILGSQISTTQLSVFRDKIDLDKNGKISLSEFMSAAQVAMEKQKRGLLDPVTARSIAVKQLQRANSIKDIAAKARITAEEAKRSEAVKQAEELKATNQAENGALKTPKQDPLVKEDKIESEDRSPETIWIDLLQHYFIEAQSTDLWQKKLEKTFKSWVTGGGDEVDIQQFGIGLKKCGVELTSSELEVFSESLDEDDDDTISLSEFMTAARWEMKKKLKEGKQKTSSSSPRTTSAASPSSAGSRLHAKKLSYLKTNGVKQQKSPRSPSSGASLPKDFPRDQGSSL